MLLLDTENLNLQLQIFPETVTLLLSFHLDKHLFTNSFQWSLFGYKC